MRGFISYAHDDVGFLDRFRVHLTAVEQAFGVTFWSDDSLRAGHHWNDTIRDAINQADVFLLLVSPSWIASKFIREDERPAIDARCAAIKGLIVPVILMPCDWERVVGRLQVAPIQGRRPLPVTQWDRDDHGFDAARVQIHAAIRDHFNVTDARNPDTDVLVGLPPEHPGPVVIERDDRLDLDLSGDAADIAATKNAITRQLHVPNRQKALDLVEMLVRAGNHLDPSWDRFVVAAKDLSAALDRPIEDIPAHLGTVWEASVRVASFLLRDKRLREAGSTDPAPLPDDIHDLFDDTVGSVAPWVRRFPGARELDDDRGAFLTKPELFARSVRVIQHAIASDLLTPATAQTLQNTIETAGQADPVQAAKAGTFSMKAARGLLTRGASYAAGFLAGAVSSGYATESPLIQRIGRFLAGVETDGIALVADLPRDIQHGIARTFERAAKPGFPGTSGTGATVPPLPGSDPPPEAFVPPDGFLAEAKAMILRGEAPPATWRPFITALDFRPENRTRDRSDLSDLRPLAALTALQSLNLRDTRVSDVTPLGALTALQSLTLNDTQVSDVTPLGALTALQSLDLGRTQVSDVTSLGALTALQSLDLGFTQVSDVTPLAALTALQSLNLWGTQVRDVTPLGALTALQSLTLWGTQVSDVTPLGALTALRSLNLGGTKVSDVTPLGVLTSLQSLGLMNTKVSNVTPLGALTSLQSLSLMNTKVSNVTPLAALKALTKLDLTGITPAGVGTLRRPRLEIIGGDGTRPRRPGRP